MVGEPGKSGRDTGRWGSSPDPSVGNMGYTYRSRRHGARQAYQKDADFDLPVQEAGNRCEKEDCCHLRQEYRASPADDLGRSAVSSHLHHPLWG